MSDNFYGDDTFEQWAEKQNKDSMEFNIIQEAHDKYPNWNLEDIKTYAPGFMSMCLKIIQDIHKENRDMSIEDIKKRALNYISAGRRSDKIHMEVFGVPSIGDYELAKWNSSLVRIMSILMSPSKYRSEDFRGHSAVVKTRLGDGQLSFRAEMQLHRDMHEITDNNRGKYLTDSDFIRELLFKGIEIYTLINKGELGELADRILFNREEYRLKRDRLTLQEELNNIDMELKQQYENLEDITRYEQNRQLTLEEFRDDIYEYIKNKLSVPGKLQYKEAIRNCIIRHRDLPRILDILEREKLVSRRYVDNILKKGISTPYIDITQTQDEDEAQ